MLTIVLSFIAGALTTLSPCVLPILPLIVAGSAQKDKYAPLFMALGLTISFSLIGIAVAQSGVFLGLEPSSLRKMAGILLILLGVIFFFQRAQDFISKVLQPIAGKAGVIANSMQIKGKASGFILGCLLGIVWSPCSGPLLGSAVSLAATGQNIGEAFLKMLVFGLGASFPLLIVAYLSRAKFNKWRSRLMKTGDGLKKTFGVLIGLVGISIVSGFDKIIEAKIVSFLPTFVLNLSTFL